MISPSELGAFINATYARADMGLAMPPQRIIIPKKYTVTFASIAAAGTQTQTLQIAANGDFFMTRFSYIANLSTLAAFNIGNAPMAQWRFQITDSGSDEQFFNAPVDLSNFANIGANVDFRDEPYPRVVTGRSTLTIQATSYEPANTMSVDLVLHGVTVKTY